MYKETTTVVIHGVHIFESGPNTDDIYSWIPYQARNDERIKLSLHKSQLKHVSFASFLIRLDIRDLNYVAWSAFTRETAKWQRFFIFTVSLSKRTPHKGPVKRKMFPFDDVIMWCNSISWSPCAVNLSCLSNLDAI